MTSGAAARLALPLSLLASLLGACRGGVGSTCRCAADCRSGLVCTAEGEKPLAAELCYKPGVSGLCTESDDIEDSGAPVELTEPPLYLDMPSKRDFQPSGSASVSDSATSVATEPTSTSTTDPGTGTGTSTGDTSTGTSSTGDTSTGTTGTTGTSTGDTSTGTSGTGTSDASSTTADSSSGSSSSTT